MKKKPSLPTEKEGKIVDYIAVVGRYAPIDPIMSTSICCTSCKGTEHYAPYMFSPPLGQSEPNMERVWICANLDCETMQLENISKHLPLKKTKKWV